MDHAFLHESMVLLRTQAVAQQSQHDYWSVAQQQLVVATLIEVA